MTLLLLDTQKQKCSTVYIHPTKHCVTFFFFPKLSVNHKSRIRRCDRLKINMMAQLYTMSKKDLTESKTVQFQRDYFEEY